MKLIDILREMEAPFQKVAFADPKNNPELATLQGAKPGSERDTELEKRMYKALEMWKNSAAEGVADFVYKNRAVLPDLISSYPKVFKPSAGTVYRGYGGTATNVAKVTAGVFDMRTVHPLAKQMMAAEWKVTKGGHISKQPITYKPHINLQSWTPYTNVANQFNKTGITLVTEITDQTSGEWILNPKSSEMFWEGKSRGEGEMIHVGTKYSTPVYVMLDDYGWQQLQVLIKYNRSVNA